MSAEKSSELLAEIHPFYTPREGAKSYGGTARGCWLVIFLPKAKRGWQTAAQPQQSCASGRSFEVLAKAERASQFQLKHRWLSNER